MSNRVHAKIAATFKLFKVDLAALLFEAAKHPDCGQLALPDEFDQLDSFGREHYMAAVDLASCWLSTSDPLKCDLFIGWVKSQLSKAATLEEIATETYRPARLIEYVKPAWLKILASRLSGEELDSIAGNLDQAMVILTAERCKKLRLLFIGDCFTSEIATALVGPCARTQIDVECVHIHEKVQAVLRNRLRAVDPSRFDLVFFSPFSRGFIQEYAHLIDWRATFSGRERFFCTLDQVMAEVEASVSVLTELFQCPVYVHNTAATTSTYLSLAGVVKYFASSRNAAHARSFVSQRLNRFLAGNSSDWSARLIDEASLLRDASRWDLGKVFIKGVMYHPTQLGLMLSQGIYLDAIYSRAILDTKKVVVCDLDNTLWNGVIGEGSVVHIHERQRILKGLKERGVLLSINSKNDPKNVHFTNASLQMEDFVAPRINWLSKPDNMAGILNELNLKAKDFVFIDDRPDELERMRNAFPEMAVMDATDDATWRRLKHWQTYAQNHSEEDRTRLYHEKAARDGFMSAQASQLENEKTALTNLQLSVTIEDVPVSRLNRTVELINRTNQFNLCGSRTTVAEQEAGLGSTHRLLIAIAKDKFGSMGMVGAMRVDLQPDGLRIPIFVLSCRVFGFGVEYALLNSIALLGVPEDRITGCYKETQHNAPCRDLYPKSGFFWNGSEWVAKLADLPADPSWLTIARSVSLPERKVLVSVA
jgi:FkbH-like protein